MALIIDLKPSERIIIGTALITNDDNRTRLHIEGAAAILREKDIMREEEANTPCKRIYFTVQLMYLSQEPAALHDAYFAQIRDIQNAAPSTSTFFMVINEHIMNGHYYKALKEARLLIEHEAELIGNVK
ncbi:MAG TPA: flagellar biosynthesis repressor FlbT [Alphaproteobacteria bacterium]|jgi:flagellar protein FlbT|nr:flagellar biosynthesis repressor FlbT [Alphaproteobacteria bacterium]